MLLIYSNTSSKRLQYICKFIFLEQLGIPYSLTIDFNGFLAHSGPKINYSDKTDETAFQLLPHTLLFENRISPQRIECFETNNNKAFFRTAIGDYPFDILAASFYLISRYEEYLPHSKDVYERFPHEASMAFKEGFLDKPLINIWIKDFADALRSRFPALSIKRNTFSYTPTYDIDIAWSYRNKGLLRNLGGFMRKPSLERLSVLFRLKADPYSSYEFLHNLHRLHKIEPIYFFLVARSQSKYDKNISPSDPEMASLIRDHAKKYDIGLHPSWRSNDKVQLVRKERKILEDISKVHVSKSRQHYIRFNLPGTFERLLEAGIENDYSMGYGSINGFRASVATPFFWYNLEKDAATRLRMYPFCYMDANSFYEQKLDAKSALEELQQYYQVCRKYNGQLITIFHNNFLGTDKEFAGWREMYESFISQLE